MAVYYLDTSAVLKRYRTEKGTDVVERLYDDSKGDLLLTSQFTCLEVESVAARALKGRVLMQGAYEAMMGAFTDDLDKYLHLQPAHRDIVNDAIYAARDFALRPLDALQMAEGQATKRAYVVDSVTFVASDKELLAAAEAAGMETFNPEVDGAMEIIRGKRKQL
jgi:predicted nucleic acid-binding protein